MSEWSHLPNAAHIDRVITSLKSHPHIWYAAWDEAWGAARGAARDAVLDATRGAAREVILALVAYDNSAKYLNMTVDQLNMWAILSEDPAAILLLPAVIALERISELETT